MYYKLIVIAVTLLSVGSSAAMDELSMQHIL